MKQNNHIRNAALACAIGVISVLLVSESVTAEDPQLSRAEETERQRVQLMVSWLEKTINNPNHVNVHVLSKMVAGGSTAEVRDRIAEILDACTKTDDICHTSVYPESIRKLGDGYVVNASLVSKTPAGIFADSIDLVFEGSGGASVPASKPLKFRQLDESIGRISEFLSATSSNVSRLRQTSALSECDPLGIGDSISWNMFQSIPFSNRDGVYIDVLTQSTSGTFGGNTYWDGSLFDKPLGVVHIIYKEWSCSTSNVVRDYEFLGITDANWDRVIIQQPNQPAGATCTWPETAWNECHRIWEDIGSNGSGTFQFRRPIGIAWSGSLFWVADSYNDRVQIYSINTLDIPATISYYDSIADGFDTPVDVAAGEFDGFFGVKPAVAVLDQGNNRVYLQFSDGYCWWNQSFPNGTTVFSLDNPTALCFGRHPIDHSPLDIIYVADNGNNRIIAFYAQGFAQHLSAVWETPFGVFPEDAHLSSVDVDNHGNVYALDSRNSVVYKFNMLLDELIAKTGPNLSLNRPSQLSFVRSVLYNPFYRTEYFNTGQVFITEHFGPTSGIRRFELGNDVLGHDLRYTPKYSNVGRDYLEIRWHQASHANADLTIMLNGQVVYEYDQWLQPAGERTVYWMLPDTALDGNYSYSLTLTTPHNDSQLLIGDNLQVVRYIDDSYVPICRFGYRNAFVAPPVEPDSTSDTCVYVSQSKIYTAYATPIDSLTGQPATGPFHWTDFNDLDDLTILFYDHINYVVGLPEIITEEPWVQFQIPYFPSGPWENGVECWGIRVFTIAECPSGSPSSMRLPAQGTALSTELYPPTECGEEAIIFPLYWDYEHTPCYDPPDPPGGCPFLYKWNGWEYEFVNNILPQGEGLAEADNDADDYYPIFLVSPVDTFYYNFLITEEEKEVSQIDKFELRAFDIPYRRGELRFNNNQELVYLTDSVSPISAVTNKGVDVTDLLRQRDGRYFEATEPGWIELVYDVPGLSANASLSPEDGTPPLVDPLPDPKEPPLKVAGDVTTRSSSVYHVLAQDEFREWQTVGKVYPRIRRERRYISIPSEPQKGKHTIRLAWTGSARLDGLTYYTTDRQAAVPVKLALVKAQHSRSGLVNSRLDISDEVRQILLPGDSIELTYYAEPPPDMLRRVFMFATRGKYRTLSDSELTRLDDPTVTDFSFDQNYPNPFNPVTTFNFALPQASHVTLEVYNVLGQKVVTLTDQEYSAGLHVVEWDSRQADGREVASGVYFARIKAGEFTASKKMVVVK